MDAPSHRLAGIDHIEGFGFVPLAAPFPGYDSADHAYRLGDASAAQAGEFIAAQWQGASNVDNPGHLPREPNTCDATSSLSRSDPSGQQVISLSPSTLSPATISSGTVDGSSPDAVSASSSIEQYRHAEPSRSRPKDNRVTKRRRRDTGSRPSATRRNVLTDADPKCMIKTDDNGNIIGALTTFGLNMTVRAQMTNAERISSAVTRQLGACHKCKLKKQRCNMKNEYEACGRCLQQFRNFCMNTSTRHQFQPCITIDIEKLRLHRKGPMINTYIQDWTASKQQLLAYERQSSSILILLTQGFGEGETNALRLMISRFEPIAGDRTAYFWTDPSGQQRSMEMPPYFISDLVDARSSIRHFLRGSRPVYLETLLADSDPLIRQTFEAALNYNAFNQSQLIEYALNAWVAARFIESHWHVFVGGYWMGVEPTNEPGHPYHGFIPVTPMMDTQLDDLVIRDLIEPLTTRFLSHLKSKIEEQNPANWLEIHFAIFIMVSNIGWITKDMASIAKWKGLKVGNRGGTLTQGYIHACKTMLSYFHFACAGPLMSLKFDSSSDRDARTKHWSPEQVEYIKHLQEGISDQESKINRWKELSMYEDPGYWCFQLLSSDWKGDVPHNGVIDDFREEDFLSSSGTDVTT